MGDLNGLSIAFDLDNTLLDPSGERYESVTSDFLARGDLGLDVESLRVAYDRVRRWGPILARLGLANSLHDRGHVDGLAAMALLFATNDVFLSSNGDAVARRDAYTSTLDELDEVAKATRRGSPQNRLEAERTLRSALSSDVAIELRAAILNASESRALREWSRIYDAIEDAHPVDDVCQMLQSLTDRGASCLVITQGQTKFQRQKIERLGIAELLSGCTLITQSARRIPGHGTLDTRIDELLAGDETSGELGNLWTYRCLLDVWGSKSPSFYARCVHALQGCEGHVEKRLADLVVVPRKDWARNPPRLVMIGDRYEKDIRPLIDLVGGGAATTVHLTAGKYNEGFSANDLPEDVRPTRSFDSMPAVRGFLEQELSRASAPVIETPPPIAPDGWFDEDVLEFGMRCDLGCVRKIAGAVIATTK